MNKNVPFISLCLLLFVSIALSSWALIKSYSKSPVPSEAEYSLYIGTNDKDTYQPPENLNEAKETVFNICMNYFPDGFTMYDANGVWRDENNILTFESTFVCIFEKAEPSKVYKVADEVIVALNQSTILIVRNNVFSAEFYTGTN